MAPILSRPQCVKCDVQKRKWFDCSRYCNMFRIEIWGIYYSSICHRSIINGYRVSMAASANRVRVFWQTQMKAKTVFSWKSCIPQMWFYKSELNAVLWLLQHVFKNKSSFNGPSNALRSRQPCVIMSSAQQNSRETCDENMAMICVDTTPCLLMLSHQRTTGLITAIPRINVDQC